LRVGILSADGKTCFGCQSPGTTESVMPIRCSRWFALYGAVSPQGYRLTRHSDRSPQDSRAPDIQLAPFFIENFSLKQLRDAEEPKQACYQAVVRSAMYLEQFNAGGPLFDTQFGDPTSEIVLRLHDHPSQPLIRSLGLDEIRTQSGRISTLRPYFPYWLNVDLSYALGDSMYWRTKNTRWSTTYDIGAD
jgi:hypothetical protein